MKPEFWRSLLGKNPKTKRYGGRCQLAFPAVRHCMSISSTGPGPAHTVPMEGGGPQTGAGSECSRPSRPLPQHLCHCRVKTTRQQVNKCVWLCSNKILFIKNQRGFRGDLSHPARGQPPPSVLRVISNFSQHLSIKKTKWFCSFSCSGWSCPTFMLCIE